MGIYVLLFFSTFFEIFKILSPKSLGFLYMIYEISRLGVPEFGKSVTKTLNSDVFCHWRVDMYCTDRDTVI